MKSKLDLAHEYFLAVVSRPSTTLRIEDLQEIQRKSWVYADSSYAENEKREKIEAEEKRKQMRELLNADNTFIEKESQHFDDVMASLENHECNFVYGRVCSCGKIKEEWQPDWSMAPEWADGWGVTEIGQAWWLMGEWVTDSLGRFSSRGPSRAEKAPSFGYQGNWRDSLRKRPK